MKKFYYILTIISVAFYLSCQNNNDRLSIPAALSGADTFNNHKNDVGYFPSFNLFEGQSLTINYINSGCFHYQNETVKIVRTKAGYLLNYTKKNGKEEVRVIADSTLDSSYLSSLQLFSNMCKASISKESRDSVGKKNIYSSNTRSLTVSDGLHFIEVPVGDIDPYHQLIRTFEIKSLF